MSKTRSRFEEAKVLSFLAFYHFWVTRFFQAKFCVCFWQPCFLHQDPWIGIQQLQKGSFQLPARTYIVDFANYSCVLNILIGFDL